MEFVEQQLEGKGSSEEVLIPNTLCYDLYELTNGHPPYGIEKLLVTSKVANLQRMLDNIRAKLAHGAIKALRSR